MSQLQVSRPTLLEVGEESVLIARQSEEQLLQFRYNSSVLGIAGNRIIGVRPGESEVTASLGGQERTWRVTVIPNETPRYSIHAAGQPCILFTPQELADFRRRVHAILFDPQGSASNIDFPSLWKAFREKTDLYLQEERFEVAYPSVAYVMEVRLPLEEPEAIPNPEGYEDFPFWTMYSRAIEERLYALSAVYLVTEEQVYAAKLRQYLLSLARFAKWYEFDRRGAEGNLSNAHFVIGAATAYDTIREWLPADERAAIANALLHRGLHPLAIDFGNMDMHNIVAAKQVAMMYAAVALREDTPYAAKYMNQAFEYISSYLDRRLVSCETEGLLYDNVAARHIWMAADLYRRATGDATLCNHPYLKSELPERYFRMLSPGTPNTFPNLSDSFYKLDLSYMMAMLVTHHSHPAAMWYLNKFEPQHPSVLMNVRNMPDALEPGSCFGKTAASRIFGTIGWSALRSGWGEKDRLLIFTSSASNRDHNHMDQNNLMLNVGGEWLLTNPGYQDYKPGPRADYTVGTVGHNALLVNGEGQRVRGGGALVSSWLAPSIEAVRGDASASYDGLLRKWSRTVLHINRTYFVIWDEVVTNRADDQVELLFHTASAVMNNGAEVRPGDRLRGREAVLQGTRESARLQFVAPAEAEISVKEYPGAEAYGPYVSVLDRSASSKKTLVTVIYPSTAGDAVLDADCSLIGEGTGGLILAIQRGLLDDIVVLSTEHDPASRILEFEGGRMIGTAAWASFHREDDGRRRAAKLGIWEGVEWEGQDGLFLQAELPVSMNLDVRTGEATIGNSQAEAVLVRIRLPGAAAKQWTVMPGEQKLILSDAGEEVHS